MLLIGYLIKPETERKKTDSNEPKKIHTVFERAHGQRIRFGPVADARSGQNPNLVIRPALQFVQHNDGGIVQRRHGRLAVRSARLHQKHFIVNDAAARSLNGRLPAQGDRRRAGRLRCHIAWRCARY